jgi:ribosomal protein S18 acetylase RimI-like enzyme
MTYRSWPQLADRLVDAWRQALNLAVTEYSRRLRCASVLAEAAGGAAVQWAIDHAGRNVFMEQLVLPVAQQHHGVGHRYMRRAEAILAMSGIRAVYVLAVSNTDDEQATYRGAYVWARWGYAWAGTAVQYRTLHRYARWAGVPFTRVDGLTPFGLSECGPRRQRSGKAFLLGGDGSVSWAGCKSLDQGAYTHRGP